MPSPFPGMDPFVEGQKWKGFHTQFVTALGESLIPQLRPRYVVDIDDCMYRSREDRVRERLPVPKEFLQHSLMIHSRHTLNLVTVLELLSPWNKTRGVGRDDYLSKRQNVVQTPANLVELDLLRGGLRPPTDEPLPAGDFHVFVCRTKYPARAEAYTWSLRDRLPRIPVPLAEGDADVVVDLQEVFATMYDRAGYDYALDYNVEPDPPLNEADAQWVRELLAARSSS